jgi:hypothetical protein
MSANRFFLLGMFGLVLMTICGSQIANEIGLRGLAQWPVAGFAVGIALACQAGFGKLLDRISALEKKIGNEMSVPPPAG